MSISCHLVLQHLRDFAPPRYALEGDPTGLQVGTADKTIDHVLCCLDLTLAIAKEARDMGAGLIISHHAVIFRPLKTLRTDQVRGQILEELIKHNIAVYVPHTALDVTTGGINDHLAEVVGLIDPTFLDRTGSETLTRIEVSGLPRDREDNPERERAIAIFEAAMTPHLWPTSNGIVALVPSRRATALASRLHRALGRIAHLSPISSDDTPRGIGRVGALPHPESAAVLAARLRETLGAPFARVVSPDAHAPLSKIAVLCGDGRSFLDAATFAGAEALITGDIDHHTALEARARGLTLIDLGHWATERHVGAILAQALRSRLAGKAIEIHESQVNTQPFELF
ncbi:MAG: Nif3-like dinuclear metal center hexameric protein [Deltaproteobacteria bacterium]|nr:Nif3-like dinuclear metal center hexameric protein [Deltaproteobacteria bacterium]